MGKKKYRDRNGFLHLEGTPISRIQVAPYLGRQIDAKCGTSSPSLDLTPPLEPKQIYYVFRGPDALFNEKTMKSFDGMPFRVGHQMLGKESANAPKHMKGAVQGVDSNPVDGCFFNVRNGEEEGRKGYLLADIVIYTERALNAIANGTKELSLGYRCTYSPVDSYPVPEYHDGVPYQFVQENIVANHLALVPHGRAGSSVCVEDEAITTEDGLIITCDSLPEEIQIMEENEKKAKDKLVGLLNGSESDIQNCLDFCDLTEEQKEMVKKLAKKEDKEEAVATDACPCKSHACGNDEAAPIPPPVKTEEEKKEEEKKEEGEAAKAAAATPAPAPAEVPAAPAPTGEKPAEEKKPEETPAQDALPVQMTDPAKKDEKKEEPVVPAAPAEEAAPSAPAPTEEKPVEEKPAEEKKEVEAPATDCKVKKTKTYTQDELDEACKKAKEEGLKEGRVDGARAHALAEAVGEDASEIEGATEADVARKACKKIKGLEFACDAADDVVIAAIRGHLTNKKAAKEAEEENPMPKKAAKKTLLSVPTQDEAIARSHVSFNSGKFTQYLATK